MKFCNNCGNPLNGEAFCTKCGAKAAPDTMQGPTSNQHQANVTAAKPAKVKIFIIAGAAVVLVAVIVLVICLIFGGGYKRTAKNFMDAVIDGDGEKMMSLILPDDTIDDVIEEEYDGDRDELISELEDMLDYSSYLDDGEVKVDYKIEGYDDGSDSEFEGIAEEYKDEFDLEVTDVKAADVEMTVEYDGETEDTSLELYLVKIDGSWYANTGSY